MIQRWDCAPLIVNLRSEMPDMTLNFMRELSVSSSGKLCIWKERGLLCTIVPTMFLQQRCKLLQRLWILCWGKEFLWPLSSDKTSNKKKIAKFNDLLYTQREMWSKWWMIHANPWVSFSAGTSRLNGTRMTQHWRIENGNWRYFQYQL